MDFAYLASTCWLPPRRVM